MMQLFTGSIFHIYSTNLNKQLGLFFLSLNNNFKQVLFHIVKGEKLYDSFQSFFRLIDNNNNDLVNIIYDINKNDIDLSFILVDSFVDYLDNPVYEFIFNRNTKTLLIESKKLNLQVIGFDFDNYLIFIKK